MNHRLPDDAKLQYFQSLLREEAIEISQSLTITTETNLYDVLTKLRKAIRKDDLKEVGRYKNDPNVDIFSDFLKR